MARYTMRPTKPQAVLTAILGSGMLAFGITKMIGQPFTWLFVLWVGLGLLIIGFTLWTAFGTKGIRLIPTIEVDEGEDPRDSRDRGQARRYRARPSKPMAVVGAVGAAGVMGFGLLRMAQLRGFTWFLVLWALFGLATIGSLLWSAFAKKGGSHTLERLD